MTRLIGLLMLLSLGLNAQANSNSCKELFILTSPEGAVQELLGALPPRGLKSEIMKEGNYKWGQYGGMNYSFSGNTFGDITLIRSFPFSLSSRLNKLSKFADAVTTKIWQNILDENSVLEQRFHVPNWPSLYLFDRNGKLQAAKVHRLNLESSVKKLLDRN